jgi:hypothetical protein
VPLRSNLTVNLGLRYERQTFTDSTKDFAPCVGFVWDMRGAGTSISRAGFGIYYSPIVDNSEAYYALTGPTEFSATRQRPGEVGFPASVADAPYPHSPQVLSWCSAGAQLEERSYGITHQLPARSLQFLVTLTF